MSDSITELHSKLMKYSDQRKYVHERSVIYDKVFSLKPKNADEWAKMGFIYNQIRETTKAISCFEEALKIEPNNTQFLQDISSVLFDSKDFRACIPYLEQIAKIDPERASNWNLKKKILFSF